MTLSSARIWLSSVASRSRNEGRNGLRGSRLSTQLHVVPSCCQVFVAHADLGSDKGYRGEQISVAIYSDSPNNFRRAWYAMFYANKTCVGDYVRQYGNLSFTRVVRAGHEGEPGLKDSSWHVAVQLTSVTSSLVPA